MDTSCNVYFWYSRARNFSLRLKLKKVFVWFWSGLLYRFIYHKSFWLFAWFKWLGSKFVIFRPPAAYIWPVIEVKLTSTFSVFQNTVIGCGYSWSFWSRVSFRKIILGKKSRNKLTHYVSFNLPVIVLIFLKNWMLNFPVL